MSTAKTKSKQNPLTLQVQTTVFKSSASAEKDEVPRTAPEIMSLPEKSMLCMMVDAAPELPYPLKPLQMAYGPDEQVYDIPEDAKPGILHDLYPFCPAPAPDSEVFDLHEQKVFRFRDAQVIRHNGRNLVVSPFYSHSGGMVVDFMPPDYAESEGTTTCIQKITE